VVPWMDYYSGKGVYDLLGFREDTEAQSNSSRNLDCLRQAAGKGTADGMDAKGTITSYEQSRKRQDR
jgi:hypothetical protein